MAKERSLRSKKEEEDMVPAIFKEDMEEASNDSGFESCEDEEKKSDSVSSQKDRPRTGNPFTDFNQDIKCVEDPDIALTIRISRKMIVDYIESGTDKDMEVWSKHSTSGVKKHPVVVYAPIKSHSTAMSGAEITKTRVDMPVPNCKLQDVIRFIESPDLKVKYDSSIVLQECKKEYGLDTF